MCVLCTYRLHHRMAAKNVAMPASDRPGEMALTSRATVASVPDCSKGLRAVSATSVTATRGCRGSWRLAYPEIGSFLPLREAHTAFVRLGSRLCRRPGREKPLLRRMQLDALHAPEERRGCARAASAIQLNVRRRLSSSRKQRIEVKVRFSAPKWSGTAHSSSVTCPRPPRSLMSTPQPRAHT